jgi:hypothetical protein
MRMRKISAHPNVYNKCLQLLKNEGFQVSVDYNVKEWRAINNDAELRGDSPVELVGLLLVHKSVKPNATKDHWWRDDPEDLISEIIKEGG